MAGNRKGPLKISFNSPVILGFTIICFVALMLDKTTAGKTTLMFFSEYHSSLLDPLTYVRFIGHIFGHAGWDHFIGNMLLFLVIAPPLEERYGSRNGGIPITLILVGAPYLSQQVYDILFVQDNVANFMHIVGGACGTVFGFAVRRK